MQVTFLDNPGIVDARLNFGPVPNTSLPAHKSFDVLVSETSKLFGAKPCQGVPQLLPFSQDDLPPQPILKNQEAKVLKKGLLGTGNPLPFVLPIFLGCFTSNPGWLYLG
nr:hypothetical protein [Rothia nasimurium]